MKKNSSFQLRSGNSLGTSATKLMKQSPAKDIGPSPTEDPLTKNIKDTSELTGKQKLDLNVRKAQNKLESDIKGFFGNIRQGFKNAKKKNQAAAANRTNKIKKFTDKVRSDFNTAKTTVQKATHNIGDKIVGDLKEAFVGENKLFKPHKKKVTAKPNKNKTTTSNVKTKKHFLFNRTGGPRA